MFYALELFYLFYGGLYVDINQFIILLAYFVIYSFGGWVLESIYKTCMQKKAVNSGFIFGPFCPIYGFGAVILYLFLDGFKSNFVIVFIVGVIIFSIWECLVGYLLEKIFNTKYWDYTKEKFNYKGRICLRMSLVWGILGVFFIYVLHPIVSNFVYKIPLEILKPILALILISMIIDLIFSSIKIKNIEIRLSKLKEIQVALNQKVLEIKNIQGLKTLSTKNIQIDSLKKTIEELKKAESILKLKLYKKIIRLKRAFPTMKSQNITEFLNQKLESIKKDKKER